MLQCCTTIFWQHHNTITECNIYSDQLKTDRIFTMVSLMDTISISLQVYHGRINSLLYFPHHKTRQSPWLREGRLIILSRLIWSSDHATPYHTISHYTILPPLWSVCSCLIYFICYNSISTDMRHPWRTSTSCTLYRSVCSSLIYFIWWWPPGCP